jgi:hypothetical protein
MRSSMLCRISLPVHGTRCLFGTRNIKQIFHVFYLLPVHERIYKKRHRERQKQKHKFASSHADTDTIIVARTCLIVKPPTASHLPPLHNNNERVFPLHCFQGFAAVIISQNDTNTSKTKRLSILSKLLHFNNERNNRNKHRR